MSNMILLIAHGIYLKEVYIMKLSKRILSVILTVFLVCQIGVVAFAAKEDSVEEVRDACSYNIIDEDNKLAILSSIKDQDYTGKVLVIPKEIDGYKIVDIADYFDYNLADYWEQDKESANIKTVTSIVVEAEFVDRMHIGDGDREEGLGLFENFVNLKSVVLPDTLKKIDTYAFKNCKNLESVKMPENLEVIGAGAFRGCEKLRNIDSADDSKIVFNDNLKEIEASAFYGCKSLSEKVYLGKNVSAIGDGAFAGCHGITGFRIAEGNENFYQKSGVLYNKDQTKIICYLAGKGTPKWTVPASVKYIQPRAFENAENLKKITLTSNIEVIYYETFRGSGLESFSAPKNLKSIMESAFENCKNLKKVTFNSKLKSIGSEAFSGCTKLEGKIELGKNVDTVYSGAFKNCDSLTGFRIADGNKYFYQKSGVLYSKDKTRLISYLPRKATENFKIPSTVKEIADYAFFGAKYIKEVTLPAGLEIVPEYCFANSNISSVKFESGKKDLLIRRYAFMNCDNLKSITIPKRTIYVYEEAIWNCDNLTKLKIVNPKCGIGSFFEGDEYNYFEGYLNEELVVYSEKGSAAEKWAKDNNFTFKTI